jgi:hypothetical protein
MRFVYCFLFPTKKKQLAGIFKTTQHYISLDCIICDPLGEPQMSHSCLLWRVAFIYLSLTQRSNSNWHDEETVIKVASCRYTPCRAWNWNPGQPDYKADVVLSLNTMFHGAIRPAVSLRTCLRNAQTVQIVVIDTKRLYKPLVSSSEGERGWGVGWRGARI